MAPLVCYEVVFPDQAVPDDGSQPGWILNVTNDAWFGTSLGPYQHLQHARIRAIEQGLPLVRAANSGISAVVDPLGRTIRSLGLNEVGVIDAPLPAKTPAPPFARFGDRHTFLVLAAIFVAITIRRTRRR
jgi:apolipoprotein N-acyltransferase